MSGFIYFLENIRDSQVEDVAKMRDLGHVLDFGAPRRCSANRGPDGKPGVVFAGQRVPSRQVGFYPDQQQWRRVPKQEGAWVGLTTTDPPSPEDLARSEQLPGHALKLADGNKWTVPVAVAWDGPPIMSSSMLPAEIQLSDEGVWEHGQIVERYRWMWELARNWHDVHSKVASHFATVGSAEGLEDDERLHIDWIFSRSSRVLGVNYVISPIEIAILGLFATDSQWDVLNALSDIPGFMEIVETAVSKQKKTPDATPVGSPG